MVGNDGTHSMGMGISRMTQKTKGIEVSNSNKLFRLAEVTPFHSLSLSHLLKDAESHWLAGIRFQWEPS